MSRGMARHRQMGGGEKYNLSGVQKMSRVSALVDMKYMREEFGSRVGVMISRVAGRVHVVWDDEPGIIDTYSEKDCRYWVDTGRWRIRPPQKGSIFSTNMRTPVSGGPLTGELAPCNDEASAKGDSPPITKGDTTMAASTITTAEFAEQLGTDTKTLRKFLRKQMSKENQPGQGGRYTFDPAEVKRLTKAWDKWSEGKVDKDEPKEAKDASAKKPAAKKGKAKKSEVIEELEEDDDDEPSDDELSELEDETVEDIEDLDLGDDDED